MFYGDINSERSFGMGRYTALSAKYHRLQCELGLERAYTLVKSVIKNQGKSIKNAIETVYLSMWGDVE